MLNEGNLQRIDSNCKEMYAEFSDQSPQNVNPAVHFKLLSSEWKYRI